MQKRPSITLAARFAIAVCVVVAAAQAFMMGLFFAFGPVLPFVAVSCLAIMVGRDRKRSLVVAAVSILITGVEIVSWWLLFSVFSGSFFWIMTEMVIILPSQTLIVFVGGIVAGLQRSGDEPNRVPRAEVQH